MPETRYIRVFEDGVEQGPEPYAVSDEQLHEEELDKEFNDSHVGVLHDVEHWDELSNKDKDKLLKFLARFYLYSLKRSYGVETGL